MPSDTQDAYVGSFTSYVLNSAMGAVLHTGEIPGTQAFVSMDIIPTGGLTLWYDIPEVFPRVKLYAEGVLMGAGPVETASVKITPLALTLQYGPAEGGMVVRIDAEGITLSAGPTTKLVLTPEGITMVGLVTEVVADTSLNIAAGTITETAEGAVERSGLSTVMM